MTLKAPKARAAASAARLPAVARVGPKGLASRAARIRLLLTDVDGVLTDGGISHFVDASGGLVELKFLNTQDGIGLAWAAEAGIRTGLISGRRSAGVEARAKMLHMSFIVQDTLDKLPAFRRILGEAGVAAEEAAYVGDDLTDVPVLRQAGLAVAVADARPEVKRSAHWTTRSRGGRGAVREVVELLLRSQGKWDGLLRRYDIP